MIAAALERNEPIPRSILERPEVWGINKPIWKAFWTLARSRPLIPIGMGGIGFGRIPYSDCSQYASDYGYDVDLDILDDFIYFIQAMDEEWLKLNQKK